MGGWDSIVSTDSEEKTTLSGSSSSTMWTAENSLKVTVKEFDGKVLNHFRHYFKVAGEDRWYPTRKGVALNLNEWDTFLESLIDIDAKVRQLRCKNEQVEPIPPTGI